MSNPAAELEAKLESLRLRMIECQQERSPTGGYWDAEDQHSAADNILCEALRLLGQQSLIDEWYLVPKWYA